MDPNSKDNERADEVVTITPILSPEVFGENTNKLPEWARPSEITRLFGIRRSFLFAMIQSGQVKSVSLRRRGCARGIRLVSCVALRSALEDLANKEAK